MQLHNKRILVMGLGIHGGGLGVARFLAAQGAKVTVTDLRGPDILAGSLAQLEGLPIEFVLGEHREEDFRNAEIVVRNPGVPRESHFLQIARSAGAAIEMEMSLFFRLCPAPILGITGTKGKTTTTLLTAAMVREQYPDAVAAGNLRISALEQLPLLRPDTPIILELSSFALEGLGEAQLSPGYAAITNLAADHLDRYHSFAAYADAKRQIYAWQRAGDVVALNADDPGTRTFFSETPPGRRIWFASSLVEIAPEETLVAWRTGTLFQRSVIGMQALLKITDVQLLGAHNRMNIAAAAALALAFGVTPVAIRRAVQRFTGVEHRLEFTRTLNGVQYINDTAATAPDAAIAALASFSQPIILIAGGADKNLPFEQLADAIRARVKAVVLLQGSATEKLLIALSAAHTIEEQKSGDQEARKPGNEAATHNPTSIIHGPFGDFTTAINTAQQLAEPGDIVLLSPGCASFGMFRNEFHRGEEFRRIVGTLD